MTRAPITPANTTTPAPAPVPDIANPLRARRSHTTGPRTRLPCTEDRHPPDDTSDPARRPDADTGSGSGCGGLRIEDPGELAAGVPVLLGFHPGDSLVLVATGGPSGRRIGLTVRVDLPPRSGTADELQAVCASAVDGLLLDRPQGAAVLVFAARGGARLPHRRLVDEVVCLLEEHEVEVHSALWAESSAVGARWACYDRCGCTGRLPDPAGTALAAAGVLEGRVVQPSRAALEQLVVPVEPERLRRREVLLIGAGEAAGRVLDTAAVEPTRALRLVDEAIADAGEGSLVLDDARVVALAQALSEPAVRDEAMRRCTGRAAAAAEQLWSVLVRETPDPEAAEPAALLAVSALLRGDGAMANVALDRAEAAWPGHRLTAVLRSVTEAGLRPAEVRTLLRASLDARPGAPALRRAGGSARTPRRRRPSR